MAQKQFCKPQQINQIQHKNISNQTGKIHMPDKLVKFRKHKYSEWITRGTVNSTKNRLHQTYRYTNHNIPIYYMHHINLAPYNIIIKRRIIQKMHFTKLFNKDTRMTYGKPEVRSI